MHSPEDQNNIGPQYQRPSMSTPSANLGVGYPNSSTHGPYAAVQNEFPQTNPGELEISDPREVGQGRRQRWHATTRCAYSGNNSVLAALEPLELIGPCILGFLVVVQLFLRPVLHHEITMQQRLCLVFKHLDHFAFASFVDKVRLGEHANSAITSGSTFDARSRMFTVAMSTLDGMTARIIVRDFPKYTPA